MPAHDPEREVQSQLYGDLEERLGGLEDLRANGAGAYAVHRLAPLGPLVDGRPPGRAPRRRLLRRGRRRLRLGSVAHPRRSACCSTAQGDLSLGAVLALFRFSQMIRQPLERIAEQMREFQKAAAGARRAGRLLATEPSIPEGRGDPLPAGPLPVDLDGVAFAYAGRHATCSTTSTSTSPPARRSAWSAAPAAARPPSAGCCCASGTSPTAPSASAASTCGTPPTVDLRRRVGVVTQDVELLRASLRDNLTLLGTVAATDDQLHAALDDVGLGEWVAGLADGLDTMLDGGGGLSAGEAQLLAFARVLLADPGLVVLDEATSRLDPDTEDRITAAADRRCRGRTVVIIAHRLATLDQVDEMLVLEHGRVVEHGRRADLAADPTSEFARLLAVSHVHERCARHEPARRPRAPCPIARRLGRRRAGRLRHRLVVVGGVLRPAHPGRAAAQGRARPRRRRRRRRPSLGLLVVLAAVEVGRWVLFWFAVVQWHGVLGVLEHAAARQHAALARRPTPARSSGACPARPARRSAASATTPCTWRWCSTCGSTCRASRSPAASRCS